MDPCIGKVYQIMTWPDKHKPGHTVKKIDAGPGQGLSGDYHQQNVTLIEWANIAPLTRTLGIMPADLRRQIVTKGVSLNSLVGVRFYVGTMLLEGIELAHPCKWLQDITGKPVLRELVGKGGIRARVVRGGAVWRGDDIVLDA